ncbi:hypothetical protein ACJX0J_032374, partial [Zea mays]
ILLDNIYSIRICSPFLTLSLPFPSFALYYLLNPAIMLSFLPVLKRQPKFLEENRIGMCQFFDNIFLELCNGIAVKTTYGIVEEKGRRILFSFGLKQTTKLFILFPIQNFHCLVLILYFGYAISYLYAT